MSLIDNKKDIDRNDLQFIDLIVDTQVSKPIIISDSVISPPRMLPGDNEGTNYFIARWQLALGITDIILEYSADNFQTFQSVTISAAQSKLITGLISNTVYEYRGKSILNGRTSVYSNLGTATTLVFIPDVPEPEQPDQSDITATSFLAAWSAVEGAEYYKLYVKKDGVIVDGYNGLIVNGLSYLVENLEPESEYTYQISSVSGDEESELSVEITVNTLSAIPYSTEGLLALFPLISNGTDIINGHNMTFDNNLGTFDTGRMHIPNIGATGFPYAAYIPNILNGYDDFSFSFWYEKEGTTNHDNYMLFSNGGNQIRWFDEVYITVPSSAIIGFTNQTFFIEGDNHYTLTYKNSTKTATLYRGGVVIQQAITEQITSTIELNFLCFASTPYGSTKGGFYRNLFVYAKELNEIEVNQCMSYSS